MSKSSNLQGMNKPSSSGKQGMRKSAKVWKSHNSDGHRSFDQANQSETTDLPIGSYSDYIATFRCHLKTNYFQSAFSAT